MSINDRAKWAYFGEIFEAVAQQGIDELAATEALLAALRSGLVARGYRRQFTFNDTGKVERLPRDIHPQPVPLSIWRDSGDPRGDLTSFWQDDPEEPDVWISIDWVSGAVEAIEWELTNFEQLQTSFHATRIPRKEADHLLSQLAGKPKKRAGRPKGPSNDWEREQVQLALRMIEGGDTRPVTAIAASLTSNALTGRALETQQRRIAWGIKVALNGIAKNSVKNKRD
ncbi:hypothetical protein [Novosphingobium sp.]|uniref:hypothetical protein n=1 Tax=Novosphingobium sp. TaxID=1874826 RepID=UPI001EBB2EE5|nr:hypothetical protein [Novosphingobium sp.]MBK6803144.1 hypothetical protein [Novosphingobium sp.]MBK9012006.1 hypothetical protein [Novosphingobium sp.]